MRLLDAAGHTDLKTAEWLKGQGINLLDTLLKALSHKNRPLVHYLLDVIGPIETWSRWPLEIYSHLVHFGDLDLIRRFMKILMVEDPEWKNFDRYHVAQEVGLSGDPELLALLSPVPQQFTSLYAGLAEGGHLALLEEALQRVSQIRMDTVWIGAAHGGHLTVLNLLVTFHLFLFLTPIEPSFEPLSTKH